jgi:hypothetical protein
MDDRIALYTNSLFLLQFLISDPAQRLEAGGDTRSILRHPFMKTVDWEEMFQKRVGPPFNWEEMVHRLVRPPFEANTQDVSITCSVFIFCHKRPLLWSGAKTLGKETLPTGGKILTDIADKTPGASTHDSL